MSHYRAPPAVLPSLRALDAPYPGDGDRSLWNEDVDEQIARLRAAAAPCPAFAVGPSDRPRGTGGGLSSSSPFTPGAVLVSVDPSPNPDRPRNPRPPRDILA